MTKMTFCGHILVTNKIAGPCFLKAANYEIHYFKKQCGYGKYQSMDKPKIGIKRGNPYRKNEEVSR